MNIASFGVRAPGAGAEALDFFSDRPVSDFDAATGTGTGFVFGPYEAWSLFAAVVRAVEDHKHVDAWRGLVRRASISDVRY